MDNSITPELGKIELELAQIASRLRVLSNRGGNLTQNLDKYAYEIEAIIPGIRAMYLDFLRYESISKT